jgi:biotin carboxyl carrier protein
MQKYQVSVNGRERSVELMNLVGDTLTLDVDGERFEVQVSVDTRSFVRATNGQAAGSPAPMPTRAVAKSAGVGEVAAPMPGVVTKVLVKKGDTVAAGQAVVLLEAMKMENSVSAAVSGVVTTLNVKAGDEVGNGAILLKIEPAK